VRKLLEHGLLQNATPAAARSEGLRRHEKWFAGSRSQRASRVCENLKRNRRSLHYAALGEESFTQLLMVTGLGLSAANLDVAGNMVQLSVHQPFAIG